MRRTFVLCTALAVLVCAACVRKTPTAPSLPTSEEASLALVLASSGKNRPEIEAFLARYAADPEKGRAARFLAANLPPADRASLSADALAEHLDYAFLARQTFPWAAEIPFEVFLQYVLPHRVSQEPAQAWRKAFFLELAPLARDAASAEEAVLRVNRWCFEKIGFSSTERWDQGPLTSIRRGAGRCEEAVILLVSALRSVGLPARQAFVPAWQDKNDNHTWTEVFVSGRWRFLESANPDFGLDAAWFTNSARRAPLVAAEIYGPPLKPDLPVLRTTFGASSLQDTARYAPASRLSVQVEDGQGRPLAGARIVVSVFNYSHFSALTLLTADAQGRAEAEFGPGTLLLSARRGDQSGLALSTWLAGEGERAPVRLVLGGEPALPEQALLRFWSEVLAAPAPAANQEGSRKAGFEEIKKRREERLAALGATGALPGRDVVTVVARAGANGPEIARALDLCPERDKERLLAWLGAMDPKDLAEPTAQELLDTLRRALEARRFAEKMGLAYDEAVFRESVLPLRIQYEPYRPWRAEAEGAARRLFRDGLRPGVAAVNALAAGLPRTPRGAMGPLMTPDQSLRARTLSAPAEAGVLCAGLLRAAGVPARYLDEQGWVEWFDGRDWLPLYPDAPGRLGDRQATPEAKNYYAAPAGIRIGFARNGQPLGERQFGLFTHFALSKFREPGLFEMVEKTLGGGFDPASGTWDLLVPAGTYWLTGAWRNERREPAMFAIPLTLSPGQTIAIPVLDIRE